MKRLLTVLGCCSIAFAVGCGDTTKPASSTPAPASTMDPNYQKMMMQNTPGGATPTADGAAKDAPAEGSTPAKPEDAPKEGDKPADAAAKEGATEAPKDEAK